MQLSDSDISTVEDSVRKKINNHSSCENGTVSEMALEFFEIRQEGEEIRRVKPATVSRLAKNKLKNRFIDIVPFDCNRVVLSGEENDYVNASYIKLAANPKAFIASQGPLESTAVDFWRMIMNDRVELVIMLCAIVETGKTKCWQYWPDETGQENPLQLGNFSITVQSVKETNKPDIIERCLRFSYKGDNEERVEGRVTQLHFTGWPDHGVPNDMSSIFSMVERMDGHLAEASPAPVVVHCSAGVGRTGVVLALVIGSHLIRTRSPLLRPADGSFVRWLVSQLRQQRPSMVQTLDQYLFVHQAVLRLIMLEIHIYENSHVPPKMPPKMPPKISPASQSPPELKPKPAIPTTNAGQASSTASPPKDRPTPAATTRTIGRATRYERYRPRPRSLQRPAAHPTSSNSKALLPLPAKPLLPAPISSSSSLSSSAAAAAASTSVPSTGNNGLTNDPKKFQSVRVLPGGAAKKPIAANMIFDHNRNVSNWSTGQTKTAPPRSRSSQQQPLPASATVGRQSLSKIRSPQEQFRNFLTNAQRSANRGRQPLTETFARIDNCPVERLDLGQLKKEIDAMRAERRCTKVLNKSIGYPSWPGGRVFPPRTPNTFK